MRRIIGTTVLVIAIISINYGQVPFFQRYYLLKRNEPVQVNKILQDKTGFIWFGTDKGLFRFDGINYHQYTSAQNLPDENVTAIAEDSLGRIWVGHKNGKLAFIENATVKRFDPPEGNSSQEISDILFDRKGNLWFSTLNDGLYYFSNERLYRLDEMDGLPDLFIYDIEEDKQGNIWAGSDKGAILVALKNSKVSVKVFNYINGLPDNIIKKTIVGADSAVWIATENVGVILFDSASGKSTPLIADWKYGAINDFLITPNQVWISTEQKILVFDRSNSHVMIYDRKTEGGLATINVLFKDLEQNIWVGTRELAFRTPGNFLEYIDDDPGKHDNIAALTIDLHGSIWYSTEGMLFKRTVKNGIVKTEQQLTNTLYEKYDVISLFADSAGYVWAGFYGEGALRINSTTGRTLHLKKELRDGNVLSITGKGNEIWLGTLGGASRIKMTNGNIAVRNYSKSDGLFSDYIYQVFVDSKNRTWFSLDGMGVDMMEDNVFHHYQDGLNSKVVYSIVEDYSHRIWVNTQDHGLYQFDGSKFQQLNCNGACLVDNDINCLATDKSGDLVVMHDFGIDVYDVNKNKVSYLGAASGINNRKPNLNAVAKDHLGNIYFGTSDGIIKYSKPVDTRLTSPHPFIETIRIAGKKIDKENLMNLRYNQNNVSIDYLGFWYQNSEGIRFRYKLENFDKDWISSLNRSAVYSDLPPGNYVFRLMTSDSDDFEGAREISLQFAIEPPFWRTIWFLILSIMLIVSSLVSFIKFRERSLRNEKRILETKVEERTIEIRNKNEEINSQAEKIKMTNEALEILVKERTMELEQKNKALEEYAFITAHNLRAPVASILGLTSLISKIKLDDDERIILDHLRGSTERLDSIVRSITEAIEKAE